jgi:hypothetical protein
MRSKVLVSLLVSGVFRDEMEIFSADDKGSVHLGGNDSAGQDTTTDGDETSERALLVCGIKMSACDSQSLCSPLDVLEILSMFVQPFHLRKYAPSSSQSLKHSKVYIPM